MRSLRAHRQRYLLYLEIRSFSKYRSKSTLSHLLKTAGEHARGMVEINNGYRRRIEMELAVEAGQIKYLGLLSILLK